MSMTKSAGSGWAGLAMNRLWYTLRSLWPSQATVLGCLLP